jgi:hypothetical protein
MIDKQRPTIALQPPGWAGGVAVLIFVCIRVNSWAVFEGRTFAHEWHELTRIMNHAKAQSRKWKNQEGSFRLPPRCTGMSRSTIPTVFVNSDEYPIPELYAALIQTGRSRSKVTYNP